jgi:hypothetical protein
MPGSAQGIPVEHLLTLEGKSSGQSPRLANYPSCEKEKILSKVVGFTIPRESWRFKPEVYTLISQDPLHVPEREHCIFLRLSKDTPPSSQSQQNSIECGGSRCQVICVLNIVEKEVNLKVNMRASFGK